jgi:hypothetical protein
MNPLKRFKKHLNLIKLICLINILEAFVLINLFEFMQVYFHVLFVL